MLIRCLADFNNDFPESSGWLYSIPHDLYRWYIQYNFIHLFRSFLVFTRVKFIFLIEPYLQSYDQVPT